MAIDKEIQQELEAKFASKVEGMIMLNLVKVMVMGRNDKKAQDTFRKEMEKDCLEAGQQFVREVLEIVKVGEVTND